MVSCTYRTFTGKFQHLSSSISRNLEAGVLLPVKSGVKWKSSNTIVAKVDSKGKVTAFGVGTAKIFRTMAKKEEKQKIRYHNY
ncbi:Ig-like domain-containing protein [Niallia sp. 03133]|uniref:Ig-like domain-containing protein n=1 Tax=Niallia sp. 03133 TaxID=3458060 RepID=UPI0040447AD9